MARKGGSSIKWLFTEGIREGGVAVVRWAWPLVLPVLTAAGQYFQEVPWVYFLTGLSVATAAGILGALQLRKWWEAPKIGDEVAITLAAIKQYPRDAAAGEVGYFLVFLVGNTSARPLYGRLTAIKWRMEGGGDIKEQSDFGNEPPDLIMLPGATQISSPSIIGLPMGFHKGRYSLSLQFGTRFGEPAWELSVTGRFSILKKTLEPVEANLDMKWRTLSMEVSHV